MTEQTEVKTGDFLPANLNEIKPFSEVEAELAAMRVKNQTVFLYDTPQGNAEARSHVYSMRLIRGRLDRTRKELKSGLLERGRLIDKEAGRIESELLEMIEIHAKPLKELEDREEARKAALNERVQSLMGYALLPHDCTLDALESVLARVNAFVVDDSLDEFQEPAQAAKTKAIQELTARIDTRRKYEEEQAELAKLRAEKKERDRLEQERLAREAAERAEQEHLESERRAEQLKREQEARAEQDRIEREARIAREAEERVHREAEERRQEEQRQREESEKRQKQEQADREMRLQEEAAAAQRREEEAKQAAQEAEERAAKAEQTARENAQREQQEREQAEREAQEKREANKRHVNKINTAAIDAIVAATGIQRTIAAQIISMIADGKIPAVGIDY